MFPLKTLVVAIVLAMAFSPRVHACPAHNHEQVVEAPAPIVADSPSTAAAAPSSTPVSAEAATAAEVASAEQTPKSAAN